MADCNDMPINNLNSPNQSLINEQNESREENKTDKVMEPILIEDMNGRSVPKSFELAQQALEEAYCPLVRDDYMVLIIHIIALEVGFIPSGASESFDSNNGTFNYRRHLKIVTQLPPASKNNGTYSLDYTISPFINHQCHLVIATCSDFIIVNCIIDNVDDANSCWLIDPALYVMSSTTNIENKFQNMKQLSRIVKDSIFNPAKQIILTQNDRSGIYLQDLPMEVVYSSLEYFSFRDLGRLEQTSKFFKMAVNDPILWKKIKGKRPERNFSMFKHYANLKRKIGYSPSDVPFLSPYFTPYLWFGLFGSLDI